MSILLLAFTISVLVLIHELGHYGVARCFNVSIETFSIGFGKPLIKFISRNTKTEFRLSPIILGGYVRFSELKPLDPTKILFEELSLWKKISILLAGPFINLLFAFLALIVFFKIETYSLIPYIGEIKTHSYAQQLGFLTGQRVTAVNNRAIYSWEDFWDVIEHPTKKISVEIQNTSNEKKIIYLLNSKRFLNLQAFFDNVGLQPQLPQIPAIIGKIEKNSAAERSGLKPGDRIVRIDNLPIKTMNQLSAYLQKKSDPKINLKVKRGKNVLVVSLVTDNVVFNKKKYKKLGIYTLNFKSFPNLFHSYHETWIGALKKASSTINRFTQIQFSVWLNLNRKLSQLSGPIGMLKAADQAWTAGLKTYLLFIVWLNIGLGIVNLLPIPILDGGQCVILFFRKIFPNYFNKIRQKMFILWSVFLLAGLFFVGMYNDLSF